MIKIWREISEIDEDLWLLPILSAIQKAEKEGRMNKQSISLYELSMHISTKLTLLPLIIKRINIECEALWEIIKKRSKSKDYWRGHEGHAMNIDDDLKYNLIIDIESLLFEFNSCLDLMRRYFFEIYKRTNKNIMKYEEDDVFRKYLSGGWSANWYGRLARHRDFFKQLAVPIYLAIDLTHEGEYYDLIMKKENVKQYNGTDKYILLSELNVIVHGFIRARKRFQKQIIEYLDRSP